MTRRDGASALFETLFLILAVFVLQQLAALAGVLGGLFVLAPPITTDPWTIVTSVYAHDGFGHLLSNAIALLLVGWPVARATTAWRFHGFFLTTGAIAGLSQIVLTAQLAFLPGISASPGVVGASGAVFALMGYLLAGNRLSGMLAGIVELPRWVGVLVFVTIAVVVTLATAQPGVALVAHFTGLLVGLLAGRARLLR